MVARKLVLPANWVRGSSTGDAGVGIKREHIVAIEVGQRLWVQLFART